MSVKNSILFLTLSKLLKIMYFFLISSNYKNTGVTFNLLMRKKYSVEKIVRLILEEVIMSDGHMSDGQMFSFFSTLKKSA